MSKSSAARDRDRRYRERLRESQRQTGTLKPQGGQRGNTNNLNHGAYSLLAMRVKGSRPNGNSKLGIPIAGARIPARHGRRRACVISREATRQ